MNTAWKGLRRLTTEGLQILHPGPDSDAQELRVSDDDQKLPRKPSEQIPGDIARPDQPSSSLPTPGEQQERQPRKND